MTKVKDVVVIPADMGRPDLSDVYTWFQLGSVTDSDGRKMIVWEKRARIVEQLDDGVAIRISLLATAYHERMYPHIPLLSSSVEWKHSWDAARTFVTLFEIYTGPAAVRLGAGGGGGG